MREGVRESERERARESERERESTRASERQRQIQIQRHRQRAPHTQLDAVQFEAAFLEATVSNCTRG